MPRRIMKYNLPPFWMAGLSHKLVNKKGRPTALLKNTNCTEENFSLKSLAMADIDAKQREEINIKKIPFLFIINEVILVTCISFQRYDKKNNFSPIYIL